MRETIVPTAGISPSAEESSPAEKLEKHIKPPRNLPRCVEKKKGRFRARVRHPFLKTRVCLGSFGTPEEAEVAVHKFREQFGCPERNLLRNIPTKVLRRLPSCVEEKKGRFRARIRHPGLKTRVSLGSFDTPEEAEVAVLKFRQQFGRDTKLRDIHNEIDEEKYTTDRAGGEEELHVGVRPSSDSGSTSFEECARLGIINEYGQLLGEYSNLDDTLWFDTQQK